MPKIKVHQEKYLGKTGFFPMYFRGNCFYLRDYPREFDTISHLHNSFKTIDELYEEITRCISVCEKAMQETDEVLIVTFNVGDKVVMQRTGLGSWTGGGDDAHALWKYRNRSSFHGMNGYGFALDYKKAFRRKLGDTVNYYDQYTGSDGITNECIGVVELPPGSMVLPYTEEAEAYFSNIKSQMLNMMLAIKGFFELDTKVVQKMITEKQGMFALTTGKKEDVC